MNATSAMNDQELILLGSINGVFGVRGWLKIYSDTKPRENIVKYRRWLIFKKSVQIHSTLDQTLDHVTPDDWAEIEIIEGKRQGKNVVAKLEGVADREQAAALIGYQIAVRRSQLANLPEGEYYWSDLIGFEVLNTEGREFGQVDRIFETGANDVLVVDAGDKGNNKDNPEILIPWVRDHYIIKVDVAARQIVVDWQEDY